MSDPQPLPLGSNRHRLTRSRRQQTGVVAVQLLLPPALAAHLDAARGERPHTEVALDWLWRQSGLKVAASPLRRGRPRTAATSPTAPTPAPAATSLPTPSAVVLEMAN